MTILENRRNKLINLVPNNSILLIFSGIDKLMSNDLYYPFVVNKNFYYFTNINENNSCYVIIKGNNQYKELYFTEERTPQRALWIGERLSKDEIISISGLTNIFNLDNLQTVISSFINQDSSIFGTIDTIYFDKENIDLNYLDSIESITAKKIKDGSPSINIKSLYKAISNLRLIKDDIEIESIKKAINITKDGIYSMMKNSKNCNYEYELESFYVKELKYNNTVESFKTIIASGHNGTILHYEENNSKFNNGNLVLCDLGALCNNYASDITRTFPINGKFGDMEKKIYEVVLEANKKSIEFLKPGVKRIDFEKFGLKILTDGLMKLGLIKDEKDIRKYYYHSLGHMLGLDVHDVGEFDTFLPGMVVTVEPGLYISELNIGIRIEDDVLITNDGSCNLSKEIIKEIDEIESFMC